MMKSQRKSFFRMGTVLMLSLLLVAGNVSVFAQRGRSSGGGGRSFGGGGGSFGGGVALLAAGAAPSAAGAAPSAAGAAPSAAGQGVHALLAARLAEVAHAPLAVRIVLAAAAPLVGQAAVRLGGAALLIVRGAVCRPAIRVRLTLSVIMVSRLRYGVMAVFIRVTTGAHPTGTTGHLSTQRFTITLLSIQTGITSRAGSVSSTFS
ncbi:MAG: hypothetical protein NT023_17250 [Armatimonadetes bacterium]|nr:hypothetical protein [Armatimonadota bacterium]